MVLQLNQLELITLSKENYYNFMQLLCKWILSSSESILSDSITSMFTQIIEHLYRTHHNLWISFVQTSMSTSGKDRRNIELLLKTYSFLSK